jgi:RNA polymerase sigma factor (sigma-70 family)
VTGCTGRVTHPRSRLLPHPPERDELDFCLDKAETVVWRALGTINEDVVQDAREAMIRAARTYNPERGMSFKNWVFGKARGHATDRLRVATRWRWRNPPDFVNIDDRHDIGATDPGYEQTDDHLYADAARTELFAQLNPRNRDIARRWLNGELMEAIGARHGISESQVSKLLTGAIKPILARMRRG